MDTKLNSIALSEVGVCFLVLLFVVFLGFVLFFFKKRSNPNNTERKPHNIAKPSFVFP